MRNRLAQPTGRGNEVLLDENLVACMLFSFLTVPLVRNSPHLRLPTVANTNPLYIREASKRHLRMSLYNDTLFLANCNVMDYSLVVGLDEAHGELVVGIVGLFDSSP